MIQKRYGWTDAEFNEAKFACTNKKLEIAVDEESRHEKYRVAQTITNIFLAHSWGMGGKEKKFKDLLDMFGLSERQLKGKEEIIDKEKEKDKALQKAENVRNMLAGD